MARMIHEFTIPETLKSEALPRVVSLRQLSADLEMTASKLGRYEVMKSQYEAVKLAIFELDGKPANAANGDVDQFWENAGPKLRSLLMQAYNRISAPSNEEEESFFESQKVRMG